MLDEYSLRIDGTGAGEYIGGKGVIRSYRAMSDDQAATITFGRNKYPLWGTDGGMEGSVNEFYIHKADGEVDGPYGVYPRYSLQKNDVLKLMTATGGGYGDPLKRQAVQVARDVKNEYYSVEEAQKLFGVKVDPSTFEYEELEIRK